MELVELMGFESAPEPESQARASVPAMRSNEREHALTLPSVELKSIAMPVRLRAFCVSEKTKENVWLAPMLLLGDTESADGWGGGMVAVQVPRATHPVLVTESAA